MYEISNWLNEKIRVASDDSYQNLSNLSSQTQKHAAFEAEILANQERTVAFTTQAETMIQEKHYAAVEISEYAQKLQTMWEKLLNASNSKNDILREANETLQFKRKLKDTNIWLEETEAILSQENNYLNIITIQQEITKHQELEKEIEEYDRNIRTLNNTAEQFRQANHSSTENVLSQLQSTTQRMAWKYIEKKVCGPQFNYMFFQLKNMCKHFIYISNVFNK